MGLTMMGGTYALGIADLYRRAGRSNLASALLRHAMTLINPTIQSAEYAKAKQQMAALAELDMNQHDRQGGSSGRHR
jgi:hypothetical protein